MDRINPSSSEQEQHTHTHTDIYLHGLLVIMLCFAGLTRWIAWSEIQSTLIGMLIAAGGGIAIGLVAYRFLGKSKNNRDTFFGMAITVILGVLTIGYLYIVHIKGPMDSIGTLNRTVKQTFIFFEFLIAHISGIKLGQRYLPKDSE